MRNSILILDAYVKKEVTRKGAGGFDNFGNTGRSVPIDVKNKMVAAFSGSSYYSRQKDALVAQIIHQYNGSVPENNDNAILSYMGILAQCKEFSDRLVSDSGNHPTVYTKSSVKSSDIIPGYYGFKFDTKNKGSHAFIINAIKWNKNGEVTHYNITESNAADSNWGNNPPGMIPWGRTVSQTKGISEKSYFEVSN